MAKEKLVELETFQKDFLIVGILFCIRDGIFHHRVLVLLEQIIEP